MLNPVHQPSLLEVFPQGSLSASSRGEGGERNVSTVWDIILQSSCGPGAWEKLQHESPDGYITSTGGAAQVAGYQTQRGRTRAREEVYNCSRAR